MKWSIKILMVVILLTSLIGIAEARTFTGVKIDYAQYGETLGEMGYGNMLYNYTYDDGTYILKAKLQKKLFPKLSLYGDKSAADIKIATHVSGPTQSGKYAYYFMYCDSEVIYQHGVETRRSDRCGDTIVNSDVYTINDFLRFQNNLVQLAMCYVDTTMDIDRIFINGVVWYPAQKGTISITSNPSGATISESGNVIGTTPATITKNEGTYSFTVKANEYDALTQSATFTNGVYGQAGSSTSLDFVLTKTPLLKPDITQPNLFTFINSIFDWIRALFGGL